LKIPEKIRISGFDFTIEQNDPNLTIHARHCAGLVYHDSCSIKISPDLSQEHKEESLLHEMIHAILRERFHFFKKDWLDEEDFVRPISLLLYDVFVNNDIGIVANKMPSSICILGYKYDINLSSHPVFHNGSRVYFVVDYNKCIISIESDDMNHQAVHKIILDSIIEILHTRLGNFDIPSISDGTTSDFIGILSRGLYQIMKDNNLDFYRGRCSCQGQCAMDASLLSATDA